MKEIAFWAMGALIIGVTIRTLLNRDVSSEAIAFGGFGVLVLVLLVGYLVLKK